jgi:hypothetical protein
MSRTFLVENSLSATWRLLADGEARPSLPQSSRIEQIAGCARFRFCLEVNQGGKLGLVGFVRAETAVSEGAGLDDSRALFLSLTKTDALFRVTVYLRSKASDVDLQCVTELAGPQELPLDKFRFVKWGSEVSLSAGERKQFLLGVNAFGLQIARSRQAEEFHERPFAGEFGLEGPVGIVSAGRPSL